MIEPKWLALGAAAMLAAVPATAAPIGNAHNGLVAIKALNLIALQDFRVGADVEGKTYVGGNLSGNGTLGMGNTANGQFASELGLHSTLAIGGSNSAQINLLHGTGASSDYGAYIVGNSTGFSTSANSIVHVGGTFSGTVNIGANSVVTAAAYAGGGKLTVASGSHFVVGGNVAVAEIRGGGATLDVIGSIADIDYSSGSTVKAGGSIGGNGNGLGSGVTAYARGGIAGNANGASLNRNYKYAGDAGAAANAVAAPSSSAIAIASLADTTAQLAADVRALSVALGGLTIVSNPSSITYSSQGPTFHAVANNGTADAYAVFTVDQHIFDYTEVSYDFGSTTLPVIINVVNSDAAVHAAKSATYNWNLNPVAGADALHNQQVIWNFTDASTLNLNRAVFGSILAPDATVANNGPINGSVIAKILNQSGEIHLGTYARAGTMIGSDDSAVPEPAVWMQLIAGFGFAGALMRRRRRQFV